MRQLFDRRLAILEKAVTGAIAAPGDLRPWAEAVTWFGCGVLRFADGRVFANELNPGYEDWQRQAEAWAERMNAHGGPVYPVTSDLAALGLELAAAGAFSTDPWADGGRIPQLWPGERCEPFVTLACAMSRYDESHGATRPERTPRDPADLRRWLTDAYAFALEMET